MVRCRELWPPNCRTATPQHSSRFPRVVILISS
jgi:hypothetical protein